MKFKLWLNPPIPVDPPIKILMSPSRPFKRYFFKQQKTTMVTHPSRVNLDSHPLALFIQQKELHHLNLESSKEKPNYILPLQMTGGSKEADNIFGQKKKFN